MKAQHDKRVKSHSFHVGDKVWLYVPAHKKHLSRKLQHLWRGPYIIHQLVSLTTGTFRLKTLQGNNIFAPVQASRLKPYTDPASRPIGEPENMVSDDSPANHPGGVGVQDRPADAPVALDDRPASGHIPSATVATPSGSGMRRQRVFAIEQIVGKRLHKGEVQYKVKWDGYPMSRCSWLSSSKILDKENEGLAIPN
jgi:hypothetical protein